MTTNNFPLLRIIVMKITLIYYAPHLQKLTEKELWELEQAWTLDRQEELKVKGKVEKVQGCCSCSSICARIACCFSFCGCREDRQTKLLRAIHEAAIKQQTRISKKHKGLAEKPFKESIFAKVRRGIFCHDCLGFVLQDPLAFF
jgi:hypothetical protein